MGDRLPRKLAAILYADVAGYSRLTGEDEDTTHRTLTEYLDVISTIVDSHGGKVMHYAGDAALAKFEAVVDAMSAAVDIQNELTTRNKELPDEHEVYFRIGLNSGDVIEDRGDIYGDGVNIAARLESLADPGGICISDAVRSALGKKLDLDYEDMGEQKVKNILEPVRAYRVVIENEKAAERKSVKPAFELPDKPSIAVLPFDNMSGDPEQKYFADGITEDIINALSRSPWLFIIARNTTFSYKDENATVRRVAQELGVRYVLQGSVRKAGNRIRVAAQLIDATTGGQVWSERYDGELADVFDLQDEITRNVVASIQTQVHLTASEPAKRSKRPDLTVWELTMRGWQLLYDFSPESFATAKTLLHQALDHDPDSAEANLVLALIHHHDALMGHVDDYLATMTTAHDLARRATRLNDRNEYAHWALGIACFCLGRHDESIVALERALELNPNCSVAYGSFGTALSLVGRVEESIANQEIAIRSNPRDPSIFFRFTGIGLAHYLAGRYDTAVQWASKAVNRMPTWYFGHFLLAASHVRAKHLQEAKAAIDRCHEVLPDASVSQLDRIPLKDAKEMERFRDSLRKAGLPE